MTDQPVEHKSPPGWASPPQRSLEVAPTYCNLFAIVGTPEIVRVAFGEGFGAEQPAIFHNAVVMTLNDARQLVQSLAGFVGFRVTPIEEPRGG
jgi:hypothetical protein